MCVGGMLEPLVTGERSHFAALSGCVSSGTDVSHYVGEICELGALVKLPCNVWHCSWLLYKALNLHLVHSDQFLLAWMLARSGR